MMNKIFEGRVSKDPTSGMSYRIPDVLDDTKGIDDFLKDHSNKKVVVVQGLGFVGAVMSLVCANALTEDYAVIGVDLANAHTYWKIRSINEGKFPIVASDPKIGEFYQQTRSKKNFYATYDSYAYSKADVIIVDINLDVAKENSSYGALSGFDVDLIPFKKAITSIGKNCREDILIVVETTVPPGTCQKVVNDIVINCLHDRELPTNKFRIGHSYERVMPGPNYIDSIQNFYRVYSGIDERSADATEKFLKTIIRTDKYPLTRLGNTNATEMAKVLENSFRAMTISFMSEWSRFAEEAEVNLYEVVKAIRLRPTHANMMYPGIGVGGYCLTKDPLLASWSKEKLFLSKEPLGQSISGVSNNDRMPFYAFEYLKRQMNVTEFSRLSVLLLGVSYRSNVGDTRYSPVEPFYNYLVEGGASVSLHDPYVSFWEEKEMDIETSLDVMLKGSFDIIAITTSHTEYKKSDFLMSKLMSQENVFIFDTVGSLSDEEITKLSTKHTVRVLGRGDIK